MSDEKKSAKEKEAFVQTRISPDLYAKMQLHQIEMRRVAKRPVSIVEVADGLFKLVK